jgi:hypothetical protein
MKQSLLHLITSAAKSIFDMRVFEEILVFSMTEASATSIISATTTDRAVF